MKFGGEVRARSELVEREALFGATALDLGAEHPRHRASVCCGVLPAAHYAPFGKLPRMLAAASAVLPPWNVTALQPGLHIPGCRAVTFEVEQNTYYRRHLMRAS
jgi:hypothetical protein